MQDQYLEGECRGHKQRREKNEIEHWKRNWSIVPDKRRSHWKIKRFPLWLIRINPTRNLLGLSEV